MPDRVRNSIYYDLLNLQDKLYAKSKRGENFNDLISLISSRENILMAYRNIKEYGSGATPGVDGKTITYIGNLTEDEFIAKVRNKLMYYKPKPVKRVEITKVGDPSKTRPLGISCILDRIVQQCFKQILEPICEAKFYQYSFGYRPLRSAEQAYATCLHTVNHAVMHFVVDIDIKGFSDNVNHNKLIKQLWSMGIRDKKCLSIIKAMLKAPILMPDNTKVIPTKGTPQGGILSPLLTNVYLNELDWWIASQWMEFPTKHNYTVATAAHQSMRKSSFLKEMIIVRYADDFKIFCRDIETAEIVFGATKQWLRERLFLDINPEKSGVTNLRKQWTDFLGFEFKVRHKPEIDSNYHKKGQKKRSWVGIGRIKREILQRIETQLLEQIKRIQKPKDYNEQVQNIRIYNQMVTGIHNYYQYASNVYFDLDPLQKRVSNIFFNRVEGFTSVRPKDATVHAEFQKKYGKSKMMRYVGQSPILPIGYIKAKSPMLRDPKLCEYTPEGRARINTSQIGCSTAKLQQLMRQKVYGTIEYQDNRISLFSAQNGKCAILGIDLSVNEIHCHHKIAKKAGGGDEYSNLIIIHEDMHRLIHATKEETISVYLKKYNLNHKQINKINNLRTLLGLKKITKN